MKTRTLCVGVSIIITLRLCQDRVEKNSGHCEERRNGRKGVSTPPIGAAHKRKFICSERREVVRYRCAQASPIPLGRCKSSTITAETRALTGAVFFKKTPAERLGQRGVSQSLHTSRWELAFHESKKPRQGDGASKATYARPARCLKHPSLSIRITDRYYTNMNRNKETPAYLAGSPYSVRAALMD